tara:strand:+ start:315 stop:521 length:207 start_codon:yes stop_codon:yes gene_type:complete
MCCPDSVLSGGALLTVNRKVVIVILQLIQQFIQYIAGGMKGKTRQWINECQHNGIGFFLPRLRPGCVL